MLFVFHMKYIKSHAQLKEKGNRIIKYNCTNITGYTNHNRGILITVSAFIFLYDVAHMQFLENIKLFCLFNLLLFVLIF